MNFGIPVQILGSGLGFSGLSTKPDCEALQNRSVCQNPLKSYEFNTSLMKYMIKFLQKRRFSKISGSLKILIEKFTIQNPT